MDVRGGKKELNAEVLKRCGLTVGSLSAEIESTVDAGYTEEAQLADYERIISQLVAGFKQSSKEYWNEIAVLVQNSEAARIWIEKRRKGMV